MHRPDCCKSPVCVGSKRNCRISAEFKQTLYRFIFPDCNCAFHCTVRVAFVNINYIKHNSTLHSYKRCHVNPLGLIGLSQNSHRKNLKRFCFCELQTNCLSSNVNKMLFSSHKQQDSMLYHCFLHAATFNAALG